MHIVALFVYLNAFSIQWGITNYSMIRRTFWIKKIYTSWKKKSVIWLSGVRRAGKTFLCRTLEDVEYFDCELLRVKKNLE